MIIIWPEILMSAYASEFQRAFNNFSNVFDIFYCEDGDQVKDIFNTKNLPKENARVYILNSENGKQQKYEAIIDDIQNPD